MKALVLVVDLEAADLEEAAGIDLEAAAGIDLEAAVGIDLEAAVDIVLEAAVDIDLEMVAAGIDQEDIALDIAAAPADIAVEAVGKVGLVLEPFDLAGLDRLGNIAVVGRGMPVVAGAAFVVGRLAGVGKSDTAVELGESDAAHQGWAGHEHQPAEENILLICLISHRNFNEPILPNKNGAYFSNFTSLVTLLGKGSF